MGLAYESLGQGPALILLHPLGADRRVWEPVAGPLAEYRRVIAVDLPGFGESPMLEQTPTPKAMADAVAGLIATLELERPHVAGNSLGGWVALELALAGQVRSVSAIAPAGLWPEPLMPKRGTARKVAAGLLPLLGALASTAAGRRLLLAGSVARPEQVPEAAAAHLVRSYATAPGFSAANNAMRQRRFVGLERIRVPVTLIWPEHDRLVARPRWLPAGIENLVLDGAGHLPMWDAPEAVTKVLLDASGGVGAPGRFPNRFAEGSSTRR